jgi:SNF2 family DNA or RNA helicase
MLGVVETAYDELTKAGIKCLKVVGETKNRQEIFDKFRADDEYEVIVAT